MDSSISRVQPVEDPDLEKDHQVINPPEEAKTESSTTETPVAPIKEEAQQDSSPSVEPPRPVETVYQVPTDTITKTQSQLSELDKERDELAAKYESGGMDFREYNAQLRQIDKKEIALNMEMTKAQIYSDMNAQRVQSNWNDATAQFLSDPENAAFQSPAMQSLLAQELQQIWKDPEQSKLSYADVLNTAKSAVQKSLRDVLGLSESAPVTPPKKSAKETVSIPQTLGTVPAARGNEVGGGEFAHLDSLTGIQLESALRRMTKDQVNRYLSA